MDSLPRFCVRFLLTLSLVSLPVAPALAQTREALSPRNANYRIEAELDVESRTISANQIIQWRNTGEQPTRELWFHLYWNAWRDNRSSWLAEAKLGWSRFGKKREIEDWAWVEVDSAILQSIDFPPTPQSESTRESGSLFAESESANQKAIAPVTTEPATSDPSATERWVGPVDLTPTLRFESPDDGNPHDRTVMVLTLPHAIEPGETVEVELNFRAKIPRTNARTGYRGDYYLISHWFPKLGVFENGSWNCHQFHAATEFYADYGVYDVQLTVPDRYVLGASGRRVALEELGDGRTTHHYRAEDVHGFAWAASPDFLERRERFEEPGLPPVEMRLLVQPEHQGQAQRYLDATRATLRLMGTWYGPYVYDQLTIVDPAWGSRTGGMEYPTLFSGGTRKFSPAGGDSPEGVAIHEAGHQFWYGMVGNNEAEAAWMDEGFVAYSTIRVLEATYPPRRLVRRYLPLPDDSWSPGAFAYRVPGIELSRWSGQTRGYRSQRMTAAPAQPTFRHYPGAARAVSYNKTTLWLATLERHLGWERMQTILSTYFQRYRFAHPKPQDLFAVIEEFAGEDLSWFIDQFYNDAVTFDYAVTSVTSVPAAVEGWVEREGELVYEGPPEDPEAELRHRSEVVVQRFGGGVFPVDVLLVFEDGRRIQRRWDGRETWMKITVEQPVRLDYAEVDPDRVLMLDVHRINNSRHREPSPRLPAVKWGSKWMIWFQDFLATFTFFV